MAITDPRAIAFSNQKGRPLADLFSTLYSTCQAFKASFDNQGMGPLFPNTTSIVTDGASVNGTDAVGGDGRPLMQGINMNQLYALVGQAISWMERNTLDGTGTQTFANRNNYLAVKVNGKALF